MCMSVVTCVTYVCDIRSPNINITFLSHEEVNITDKARSQPIILRKHYIISIPEDQKLASDGELCFI